MYETNPLKCRLCGEEAVREVLNFGLMPIANELLTSEDGQPELFPLVFKICLICGLGQVDDVTSPKRLFQNYRYSSSISKQFTEHAQKFAETVMEECEIKENDFVLEIASNDGYLLKNFKAASIKVLGIEPAENIAYLAELQGIETVREFFTKKLSKKISQKYGHPKLIVANNVLAHVPDINDFMAGIRELADKNTLISIENPSIMNILIHNQFDTIYHEHYSYLSANSVNVLALKNDLELWKLEKIQTHGGSLRYWLRVKNAEKKIQDSVTKQIKWERENGLFSSEAWIKYKKNAEITISNFKNWIDSKNQDGSKIYGYGAAAKASTLINAAKIQPNSIKAIFDNGPEKIGYFMPAANIPILHPDLMVNSNPTDILIFPWNVADEIIDDVKLKIGKSARIWTAIPELREYIL